MLRAPIPYTSLVGMIWQVFAPPRWELLQAETVLGTDKVHYKGLGVRQACCFITLRFSCLGGEVRSRHIIRAL